MLWPRNGLGFPMISPVIEHDLRRRFSPSALDESGVGGLEFGVSNLFGIWDFEFPKLGLQLLPTLATESASLRGGPWEAVTGWRISQRDTRFWAIRRARRKAISMACS